MSAPWLVNGGMDAWGPPTPLDALRKVAAQQGKFPPGLQGAGFHHGVGIPAAGIQGAGLQSKGGKRDPADVTFLEALKPLIGVMQAAIVLPIQKGSDGMLQFKLVSLVTLYSVSVFAALSVPLWYVSRSALDSFSNSDGLTFSEQIYAMTPLLLLHTHPLIPILYWREGKAVSAYFNSWGKYEFRRVCGRPLGLRLSRTVIKYTLSTLLFSLVYSTTMPLYMSMSLWQTLPYLHLAVVNFGLVCLWSLCSLGVGRAAERLRDALHNEVSGGSSSPQRMCEFRQLWLELSDLTQEAGTAWTYSWGHMLLYQFLLMTLTSFGVLAGVTQNSLDGRTLAYGALAVISGLVLFVVCSTAESAADKVSSLLREDLLAAQLSSETQVFKNEVQMFMTALAMNPASVNLSGYATVNRALFATLLETMVTYLVVLVQFAYSLDSPTATGTDTAGNSTVDYSTTTPASS